MSLFKTRRDRNARAEAAREPAAFDSADADPRTSTVDGVGLESFITFVAVVGQPEVLTADHETIALQLGFPAGRYDLIRNLWMTRIYSSPSLAREFGVRLDEARKRLV